MGRSYGHEKCEKPDFSFMSGGRRRRLFDGFFHSFERAFMWYNFRLPIRNIERERATFRFLDVEVPVYSVIWTS